VLQLPEPLSSVEPYSVKDALYEEPETGALEDLAAAVEVAALVEAAFAVVDALAVVAAAPPVEGRH